MKRGGELSLSGGCRVGAAAAVAIAAAEAAEAAEAAARREGTGDSQEDGDAATAISDLPIADYLRFNAAGLQAMLSEGCLYGWLLWGVEAEVADQLSPEAASALLVPPKAPGRE